MTRRWLGPVVLLLAFVFALVVYPSLPERVPTHWNFQGEADGWMSKWPGALLLPLEGLAAWLLVVGLRRIDPRRSHYERFNETFWLILNVLGFFFAAFTVISLGAALGWPMNISRLVMVAIGLLFMTLGNYLPRLKSNWWMGIRTPWTLESEAVWRATHRVGGRTFVAGGLIAVLAAFLPMPLMGYVAIASLVLAGLVPLVYSYVAWRQEQTKA